ncbi:MAG: DUF3558 domain-containing protein [Azonexus sp.]|jgi:hypothetical protein|uniref:hypothetical protein n=1 Tax=Azonexus sp. TaxID=1872668 RepID=UPI00282BEA4A|nr:hypothetical protein [Azonexus sp.]MDR0777693.1 DUF3558 domain-containing protein [Azonexus sp.]
MKNFRKGMNIAVLLGAISFMAGCGNGTASATNAATEADKPAATSKTSAPLLPECALLTNKEVSKALATKVSEGRLSETIGCQWIDISKDHTGRNVAVKIFPASSWWGDFNPQTDRKLEGIGEKAYLSTASVGDIVLGWDAIAHTKNDVVTVWISKDPAIEKTAEASAVELLKIAVGRLK